MNDWKEGPPPEVPGPWFVVYTRYGSRLIVQFRPGLERPWFDDDGDCYSSDRFVYHLPTPIEAPKES